MWCAHHRRRGAGEPPRSVSAVVCAPVPRVAREGRRPRAAARLQARRAAAPGTRGRTLPNRRERPSRGRAPRGRRERARPRFRLTQAPPTCRKRLKSVIGLSNNGDVGSAESASIRSCRRCRTLEKRVERLEAENAKLRKLLAEAERAGKRQAAPFSTGDPKEKPKKPGRSVEELSHVDGTWEVAAAQTPFRARMRDRPRKTEAKRAGETAGGAAARARAGRTARDFAADATASTEGASRESCARASTRCNAPTPCGIALHVPANAMTRPTPSAGVRSSAAPRCPVHAGRTALMGGESLSALALVRRESPVLTEDAEESAAGPVSRRSEMRSSTSC